MTNLRRVTAATVLAAAAAATVGGCASDGDPARSSSEPESVASTPPSSTGATSETASTTAGVATGEPAPGNPNSALLRIGPRPTELPADFRPAAPASARLPGARVDNALQRCVDAPNASSRRTAGATSTTFGSPYGGVRAITERYDSQRAVTDAVAALSSRRAQDCFGRWFAAQRATFTGDDATPAGSSVEVRPGTNDGPRNVAGVASARYEYRSNGGATYPVSVAVYYLTGPEVLTRLIVTKSGGDAFDRHLNDVLVPVAARTAAA